MPKNISIIGFIILILSSCGQASPDSPAKQDPAPIAERYHGAVARLDSMLDQGWVVSRHEDGTADDLGDSLLFTGIALAALPCEHDSPFYKAFPDGKLYRHPGIPNEFSLDGAIGFYFGIASHISRCGSSDKWNSAYQPHAENDYSEVPKEFTFIKDSLAFRLGLRGEPSSDRRTILEIEIVSWAKATMSSHSACYRVHLGWLAMRTMELLDVGPSHNGRNAFCAASDGADLPVVDNWCGRGNLIQWVDEFQFDQWGYRHQRCPDWDTQDGNGKTQPGVDYLIGIRESYNIP